MGTFKTNIKLVGLCVIVLIIARLSKLDECKQRSTLFYDDDEPRSTSLANIFIILSTKIESFHRNGQLDHGYLQN